MKLNELASKAFVTSFNSLSETFYKIRIPHLRFRNEWKVYMHFPNEFGKLCHFHVENEGEGSVSIFFRLKPDETLLEEVMNEDYMTNDHYWEVYDLHPKYEGDPVRFHMDDTEGVLKYLEEALDY